MKDTVIKGNGKSRKLKAPADMPATFEAWRAQMLAGEAYLDISANTDLAGANAGIDLLGNPLASITLLQQDTAESFDLDDATPDETFRKIRDELDNRFTRPQTFTEETALSLGLPPEAVPDDGLQKIITISNAVWQRLATFDTAGAFQWVAPDLFGDGRPYKIGVLVVGAGGAGAGGTVVSGYNVRIHGGASGRSTTFIMTVVPGTSYAVVVGAKGIGIQGTGGAGGTSSFNGETAAGGKGGALAIEYQFRPEIVPPTGGQSSGIYGSPEAIHNLFGGERSIYYGGIDTSGFRTGQMYPTECVNLFECKKILAAGGSLKGSQGNITAYAGGIDPLTGLGGGAPKTATTAQKGGNATLFGSGGGAALTSQNGATASTGGDGVDGAVFLYIQGLAT